MSIVKCPDCGRETNININGICQYCGFMIESQNDDVPKTRPFINGYIGCGVFSILVAIISLLLLSEIISALLFVVFGITTISIGIDRLHTKQLIYDKYKDNKTKYNEALDKAEANEKRQTETVINMSQKSNKLNYNGNTVTCPYCKSTNTKKISGLSKAGSVGLFGIFAMGKVSKQWHCNNCKSDF